MKKLFSKQLRDQLRKQPLDAPEAERRRRSMHVTWATAVEILRRRYNQGKTLRIGDRENRMRAGYGSHPAKRYITSFDPVTGKDYKLPAGSFELVVLVDLLEFAEQENVPTIVQEAVRKMAQGGRLLISVEQPKETARRRSDVTLRDVEDALREAAMSDGRNYQLAYVDRSALLMGSLKRVDHMLDEESRVADGDQITDFTVLVKEVKE